MDTDYAHVSQAKQHDLLYEGHAVLIALGEKGLAREYLRRARGMASREELVELLLTCIALRRAR